MEPTAIATLLALWSPLRGPALEAAIRRARWYVHRNDMVGGWCVMPADVPPSSGIPEVASTMSYSTAVSVAEKHNFDRANRVADQAAALTDQLSPDACKTFLNWFAGYEPWALIEGLDRYMRRHPTVAERDADHAQALLEHQQRGGGQPDV